MQKTDNIKIESVSHITYKTNYLKTVKVIDGEKEYYKHIRTHRDQFGNPTNAVKITYSKTLNSKMLKTIPV